MKEMALYAYDSNDNPCGWVVIVDEVANTYLIATISIDWFMAVIK